MYTAKYARLKHYHRQS